MKPSRVAHTLSRLLKDRWPAFIWGPPGCGKSSVVRQVAADGKMELVDIRAPLLDPTDLRGIPAVDGGVARWYPPSFLPSQPCPGVLFFDELNAAPPLVQSSLYQLVLDRRIGEYVLPDGWHIVAAGNRAEDRAVVYRMPSALANRFIHLDFEIDFDDWKDWALGAGVHPLVMGFLATRRELLFDMDEAERAFPTPRSWEMSSDALRTMGSLEEMGDVLPGIVGEAATIEFLGYCQSAITERDIAAIIADPLRAPLPQKLGDLYALVSYLAADARRAPVRAAAGVLLERLPVEMAVLLVRDVARVWPAFVTAPVAKKFLAQHQSLIL